MKDPPEQQQPILLDQHPHLHQELQIQEGLGSEGQNIYNGIQVEVVRVTHNNKDRAILGQRGKEAAGAATAKDEELASPVGGDRGKQDESGQPDFLKDTNHQDHEAEKKRSSGNDSDRKYEDAADENKIGLIPPPNIDIYDEFPEEDGTNGGGGEDAALAHLSAVSNDTAITAAVVNGTAASNKTVAADGRLPSKNNSSSSTPKPKVVPLDENAEPRLTMPLYYSNGAVFQMEPSTHNVWGLSTSNKSEVVVTETCEDYTRKLNHNFFSYTAATGGNQQS